MSEREKTYVEDVNRSIYYIRNEEKDVYRIQKGLTPAIVEEISAKKNDPAWMANFRLQSLQIYNEMEVPDWGPSIEGLNMEDIVTYVKPNTHMSAKWSEVPEDITKVSVYLHEGVENYVERFVPRWKQANCAVAGPYWIDTTFANKGIGVQCVCRTLGIDPAQVMAFGDNYNDETMLDVVGVPYIMDNAATPLRAKYQNHTPRPEDVLAQLLAQQP